MPEQSELKEDDLQNSFQTISKNQLEDIRTLQTDTNKFFGKQVENCPKLFLLLLKVIFTVYLSRLSILQNSLKILLNGCTSSEQLLL